MIKKFAFATAATLLIAGSAWADLPGKHPHYLHALEDLRNARWMLSHQPGDVKVYEGEDIAITELNAAIGDIKKAAIDDGKDINDHPMIDVKEHGSRLLKSIEALRRAKDDVNKEEDNPEARGLKHRTLEHLDRAIHAAEKAHAAWLKEMGK